MVQIIIAILAIVALYFFIKKYASIDAKLFDNGSYVPMGSVCLYISICLGAIMGFVVAIYSMVCSENPFDLGFSSWGIVCHIIPYLLFLTISVCFYRAFSVEAKLSRCIWRSLFMLVACLLGFIGGVLGSVITLLFVCLWVALKVILAMLGGSSSRSSRSSSKEEEYDATITDESGFERKLKETSYDTYVDDKGDRWKKVDGGHVVRED